MTGERRSSTEALISAARTLANDIKTQDGVANEALREIADRLEEQADRTGKLDKFFRKVIRDYWYPEEKDFDFDFTEFAESLGLVATELREEPCGLNCTCQETGGEFPLDCLRFVNHDK